MFVADPNYVTSRVDVQHAERLTCVISSPVYELVDGVFIYSSNAR
jgi:hypothetical protein